MIPLATKTIAWLALLAACLLAPVGADDWPMGWAVLACYTGVVLAAFALVDHDLLRERSRLTAGGESRDMPLALLSGAMLYPVAMLVAGLDRANGWTAIMISEGLPTGVKLVGLACFLLGYAIVLWAMHTNRFFTTVVRVQDDRGHRLIDRGPYAWVRHPGYTGTIFAHLGMAAALGSTAANTTVLLGGLALIARIGPEERLLAGRLDGYANYQRRVRWRLVPGVW